MRDLWELLPLRYVQFNECLHVLHCLFLLIQICSVWQPHEHQLGTPLREAIAAIIDLKWANSRIFKMKAAVWLTRPSLRVKEILLSSRPSSGSSFYAKTNKKLDQGLFRDAHMTNVVKDRNKLRPPDQTSSTRLPVFQFFCIAMLASNPIRL